MLVNAIRKVSGSVRVAQLQFSTVRSFGSTKTLRRKAYEGEQSRFSFLQRCVSIVGAPVSAGQPRAGTELAPAALRNTGLLQTVNNMNWEVKDCGDARWEIPEKDFTTQNGIKRPRETSAACKAIHDMVYDEAESRNFVLTIGGDHSVAAGSLSAILRSRPDTCVVWVDAHADINTDKTSSSGNMHGMPVAMLMQMMAKEDTPGWDWIYDVPKLKPARIVYIGLRSVDDGEKKFLQQYGIHAYSMSQVDEHGIGKVCAMALEDVDPYNCRPIHLSLDVDGIDPYYTPSTGTPVEGGLSLRECRYICETLASTKRLCSMDLVEVNTRIGNYSNVKRTIDMSLMMVSAALGETLLLGKDNLHLFSVDSLPKEN